jgi:hypothetical protein
LDTLNYNNLGHILAQALETSFSKTQRNSVATLKSSQEKMPKGESMTYLVIYLIVSFLTTAFLWGALALAKQTDDEKKKNKTGIIFKLASTRVTNREQ